MERKTQRTERPPIVAVLGHVDHGKSTLLDFIRKSNTVESEAGGITQRVAAYEVTRPVKADAHAASEKDGAVKRITFIDTPGHAAFQAIRARGASVADIAILVVAADDGVKPQTLEALHSIRAAETPFIVAINKIDKPGASVERTQASLMENQVFLENLGGDVPWVAISAKTGAGVDELLDLILLVAEVEELTGDATAPARGYVLEAHRDEKRGLAATLVITDGTLESGMAILAGHALAPVRIMEDHTGAAVRRASFSTPITLIGFDELPEAGAAFTAFATKRDAETARPAAAPSAVREAAQAAEDVFWLPIIVRADAAGSLEAIAHMLAGIGDEHARISLVQSGIGSVTEGDVKTALAGATPAAIIGFGVGVDHTADVLARQHGVRIERFSIIYELAAHAEELLRAGRPARTIERIVGRARVLKVFSNKKEEYLLGARAYEGYVAKKAVVRLMRREQQIGEGAVVSLQTNKQRTDRVEGQEFGAQIELDAEPKEGDVLECVVATTE